MPKLVCACGHVTSLSPIPNEAEWCLVRDTDVPDEGLSASDLYATSLVVVPCRECGRLVILGRNGRPGSVYVRESGPDMVESYELLRRPKGSRP